MTARLRLSINIQKEYQKSYIDLLKDKLTTTAMPATGPQCALQPEFNLSSMMPPASTPLLLHHGNNDTLMLS